MSKQFHVSVILSCATAHIFTNFHPNAEGGSGFGEMYALWEFMTGEECYTTQIPRVNEECRYYMPQWAKDEAERFKQETLPLMGADGSVLPQHKPEYLEMHKALYELVLKHGEWHEVDTVPMDDHESIDFLAEFQRDYPDKQITVIDLIENTPPDIGDINWKVDDAS